MYLAVPRWRHSLRAGGGSDLNDVRFSNRGWQLQLASECGFGFEPSVKRDKGMAATVAPFMPSAAEIAQCKWLAETEVEVYATEYARTQFTGALQGYRVRRGSDPKSIAEMHTFSGRTIDVPSMFIGGRSDWGVYQTPGAAESMQKTACTRMVGFHLVEGAGHWVQQEQPEKVTELLTKFLQDQSPRDGQKPKL